MEFTSVPETAEFNTFAGCEAPGDDDELEGDVMFGAEIDLFSVIPDHHTTPDINNTGSVPSNDRTQSSIPENIAKQQEVKSSAYGATDSVEKVEPSERFDDAWWSLGAVENPPLASFQPSVRMNTLEENKEATIETETRIGFSSSQAFVEWLESTYYSAQEPAQEPECFDSVDPLTFDAYNKAMNTDGAAVELQHGYNVESEVVAEDFGAFEMTGIPIA